MAAAASITAAIASAADAAAPVDRAADAVRPVNATPAATPAAAPEASAPVLLTGARGAVAVRLSPAPAPSARWVDPMPQGTVTSCFGPRWGRQHAGVDVAAPAGTTVVAAGAGQVVSAGATYGGYGISVLIQHADGVTTHYAHLSATAVQAGQTVAAGQPIGAEGSTGNSTGPHLHFEVREGGWDATVEPTAWMRQRGVDLGCDSSVTAR